MKRIVVILAVLLVASAAFAQSNQVLSRNAVGYVKTSVASNGLQLVALNFESLDGADVTIDELIGDQIPGGSYAFIWDSAGGLYQTEIKSSRSGAWSPNTNPIMPGVGFWLEVPAGVPSNSYDVYLMGEVPSSTNYVKTIPTSYDCVGYMYPVSTLWTNTQLAQDLVGGSFLFMWNGTGYDTHQKSARSGAWSDPSLVIEPGEGFWINNVGASFDWDETKPYTWP